MRAVVDDEIRWPSKHVERSRPVGLGGLIDLGKHDAGTERDVLGVQVDAEDGRAGEVVPPDSEASGRSGSRVAADTDLDDGHPSPATSLEVSLVVVGVTVLELVGAAIQPHRERQRHDLPDAKGVSGSADQVLPHVVGTIGQARMQRPSRVAPIEGRPRARCALISGAPAKGQVGLRHGEPNGGSVAVRI